MPLRDHFHPQGEYLASWEEVHGAWPATIAYRLNAVLPPQYRSGVNLPFGTVVEVEATNETPLPGRPKRQPSYSRPKN